ncbi:hypothetical protein BT96DRAFT_989457 [Gymnopus androsaceus JB14]|uniref:F-box domain-containing protein n=1 Tax=Gymnopus androsaceus JB14 TaxID=1447944 RepID=A0A6A4I5N1_9AGAR|nr:hypothetical protein BT96DRAFT_989457 [Gymnopus androsaceus JB14]
MTLASWYTSGELLDDFFSRFTFPSLTVLNLHLERDQERKLFWSVDAFDAFISRSSCILTTLSIRGVIISDLELIAALHLLPSLVNLSFDDSQQAWESPITSLFLSRLTLPESPYDPSAQSQSILIPKLCSLVIKFKGTSFDDAAFVKMISSRCREVDEDVYGPLYELDKVRMRWGREVNEETELRPLSNLHRLGMRVVITGKHYNG